MQEAAYDRQSVPERDAIDEIFNYTLADFPAIDGLRRTLLEAQPAVALERSLLLTEYHEKNGFDLKRPIIRQAESLKYILSNLTPVIFPDELIVGSTTEHRLGCLMFPEFQASLIWPDMLKLPHRKDQPVSVSREAIEEYSFRIFPFFKDLNINEWAKKNYGYSESLKLMERMIFFLVAQPVGVSHIVPGYMRAVEMGFNGIIGTARQKMSEIVGDSDVAKESRDFYKAVEIVSEGVIVFADNYADECARQAGKESDPGRRADLEDLSRILRKVPAEPAETFWEVLESLWITHVALQQENSDMAMSFGRLDEYLYPYYIRDMENGIIDRKRALELVMAFYIKTNDHTPMVPSGGQELFSGAANNQSVTLGGVAPDGGDIENDLSYIMLQAINLLRLREPNVDARFHKGSSDQWYRKTLDVVRSTGAAPALYNDEVIVPSLVSKGATIEDARDYGLIGCVETAVPGKSYPMTGSILLNLAAVLELTLNDGVHKLSGLQIGPKTGRFEDFDSYDDFRKAFIEQLTHMIDLTVDAEKRYDRAHAELHPIPLMSSLLEGPMDAGRDVTLGTAVYNSSGVWVVGFPDVVDSLAVLKKLVFDEGRIGAAEMKKALDADFAGYEKVHALCVNKAPKYGNDDSGADDIAVYIVEEMDRLYNRHTNFRGGPYHIGYWSITFHTGYGGLTGALPNGRKKGQALSSGATPVSGAAKNGPSASLCSTAKLPPHGLANCIANNHKIPAALLDEEGKMNVLESLVRGYFDKGGMQLQFVIADKNMLLEALDNPELAKNLLVRVSGYTAYFGDLDRKMQEEIINRTEDLI